MKNDSTSSAIINFLLPLIFLYGLFFLIGFFDSGFFAFIYSLVLFSSAIMVFYIFSEDLRIFSQVNLEYVGLFVILVSLAYVCALLYFVTES